MIIKEESSLKKPRLAERALETLEWSLIREALASRTHSPLGHALALLHTPFSSAGESQRLRTRVLEAMAMASSSPLPRYIHGTADPREFFEHARRESVLGATELFVCSHFMESIGLVGEELRAKSAIAPQWADDFKLAPKTPAVCAQIQRSVSSEGAVLDTASAELARLRRERAQKRAEFENTLDRKIKDWSGQGLLQDNYYDVIDGRYVVPVRVEQQSKLSGALYGRSNTGQSVFIEPAELTVENNALKALDLAIRAEEYRILKALSGHVSALSPDFAPWVEPLAELDLALAASTLSHEWELREPLITQRGLTLIDVFHPGLKSRLVDIVKNTLSLSEQTRGILISGPNTGGKTVLLKAAGLSACMARAGLLVPAAKGSQIPHYSEVLAFIGDEQSLAAGLSSFSAQIMDMRQALESQKNAGERPMLIIVDEMLSSTDPEEASALAQALIEEFVERGHHVLVTSHFSELSLRCKTLPHLAVAAMEFDEGRPTYKLRPDELGSSHALEVAERLGLPRPILARARTLVSTAKLDYEKAQLELKNKEIAIQAELERERQLLQGEKERHKSELAEKLSEFMAKLQRQLDEAVQAINSRFLTASRIGAKAPDKLKSGLQTTMEAFENAADEFKREMRGEGKQPVSEAIDVGTTVRIRSMGRVKGQVLALQSGTGSAAIAQIQVGNFKVERPLSDLEFTPEKTRATVHRPIRNQSDENVPSRLDLRGQRFDEALGNAERYIDHAFRNGASMVTVITGHGTGALKKGLKDLLKTLPYVREFRPEREGDDGATLIEFDR